MCVVKSTQQYLCNYPNDGYAWLILGETFGQIARYKDAVYALRQAIRFFPEQHLDMPYAAMGEMYLTKGSLRAAERWYRKALAQNSNGTQNFIFLGTVLARQGRFAEAKRYHRQAAKLSTEDWDEAYYNLGLILRAERKYNSALICLNKAIKLDPEYEEAKQVREDMIKVIKIRQNV